VENLTKQQIFEKYPEMLEIYLKVRKKVVESKVLGRTARNIQKQSDIADKEAQNLDKEWMERGVKLGLWRKDDF